MTDRLLWCLSCLGEWRKEHHIFLDLGAPGSIYSVGVSKGLMAIKYLFCIALYLHCSDNSGCAASEKFDVCALLLH